ncbi:hypothetical protein [Streptomyces sp. NPDC051569]|uniref:hypothetical protein n=1 Tax=Streptomyces sp. NPDC051569 TaxID=3365661 RepID=UPI0037AA0461
MALSNGDANDDPGKQGSSSVGASDRPDSAEDEFHQRLLLTMRVQGVVASQIGKPGERLTVYFGGGESRQLRLVYGCVGRGFLTISVTPPPSIAGSRRSMSCEEATGLFSIHHSGTAIIAPSSGTVRVIWEIVESGGPAYAVRGS